MRVTMLGCGGSGGVPLANGTWGPCDPANPKNRRRRPSILIREQGRTILVDTGPDMREQLLDAGCTSVDAILYTHAHADHVHGLDDVRSMNHSHGAPIPAFGSAEVMTELAQRFRYVFTPIDYVRHGFYRPQIIANPISGAFHVDGIAITAIPQDHHSCISLGFRIGAFAYSTDVVHLDDAAFAALEGIDTWIVGCLREAPHPAHAHLARTLSWIERVKPRRAILTHMNHEVDYDTWRAKLPPGVEPGYDGLVLDI